MSTGFYDSLVKVTESAVWNFIIPFVINIFHEENLYANDFEMLLG